MSFFRLVEQLSFEFQFLLPIYSAEAEFFIVLFVVVSQEQLLAGMRRYSLQFGLTGKQKVRS